MIRLGLRLTIAGGREALTRLLVMVLAVALGVGMLLATIAGINAVNTQNDRYAWIETGSGSRDNATAATVDPLWWKLTADRFNGKTIGRVDLAGTGPASPVPPGMTALPKPGQYFASPAMERLLRKTPAAELAVRYPGHLAGTVSRAALPSPDALLVVIGRTPTDMARVDGAKQVARMSTVTPSQCNGDCALVGINANGIDLVLSIAAAALIFPVLVFIATATRLSAARREQRFAAMRLVGATPRQISVISTVESTCAAALGVLLGCGLMFALRAPLAQIPFTGQRFYPSDLSVGLPQLAAIIFGVPIAAAVAARIALRRVQISPLGVSRRVTPKPPSAWRVLPLVAGLGILGYFVEHGRPATTQGQIDAYLPAMLLVMLGLITGGPWFTMVLARLIARRTRRPGVLLAARRLGDDPKGSFRAVSGLVLALFVMTVAVGTITTINAYDGGLADGSSARAIMTAAFFRDDFTRGVSSLPTGLVPSVQAVGGVRGVALVHIEPHPFSALGPAAGVIACADLAQIPAAGHCAPGATAAQFPLFLDAGVRSRGSLSKVTWPALPATATEVRAESIAAVVVVTDGSTAANERARTLLETANPRFGAPETIAESNADHRTRNAGYQRLAEVVILATLPIAGCSLAVSIVAGLADRRRPFSLLRLTGAPLALLRRVVTFETAVPMLAVATAAIAAAFGATAMFVRSQLSETLQPPGIGYYVVTVLGLLATLAIIASTFPFLRRVTGPEAARND